MKNVKFMENKQQPSKKRKNGMIDLSIEQMGKSPKKKFQVVTKGSGQHTRSEASMVIIKFFPSCYVESMC